MDIPWWMFKTSCFKDEKTNYVPSIDKTDIIPRGCILEITIHNVQCKSSLKKEVDYGRKSYLHLRLWVFLFLFWPPHSIWSSQARDQIQLQSGPTLKLQQYQILNPLCWAGDWTYNPVLPRGCWSHCATAGTLVGFLCLFYPFWQGWS